MISIRLQESRKIKSIEDFKNLGINYIVRVANGKKFLPAWVFEEKNLEKIEEVVEVFLEIEAVKDANFATDQAITFMLRAAKKPADLDNFLADYLDAVTMYGQCYDAGWFKAQEVQQAVNAVFEPKSFPSKELHSLEKLLQDTKAKKSKSKNVKAANSNSLYTTLYEDGTWKLCVPKSFEGDSELASHIVPFDGRTKTAWCTASSKYYFDRYSYNNTKPLYVFQYFKDGKYTEAWQLAFMKKHIEFMDKEDSANYRFVLEKAPEELLELVKDVDADISLLNLVKYAKSKNVKISRNISEIYEKYKYKILADTIKNEFEDKNEPGILRITSDDVCKKIRGLAGDSYEAIMSEYPVTTVILDGDAPSFSIKYNLNVENVIVTENATAIPSNAFLGCSCLKSVKLHDKLKSIGANAFTGCRKIEDFELPTSLTDLEAGAIPDSETIDLSSYKFKKLGNKVFHGYSRLKKLVLPDTIKTIGAEAFANCSNLESVNLPTALEKIGKRAFDHCTNLKYFIFPANPMTIGTEAFIYSGIEGIDLSACTALKIERAAFYGCTELKNVVLADNLKSIGVEAFEFCAGLQTIKLPEGLETIEEKAFASCKGLTELTIPSSVQAVGNYAFMNCKGLKSVKMSSDKPKNIARAFLGTGIKV